MAKRKLQRFEELKSFQRTFQFPFPLIHTDHGLKGNWAKQVFENSNPVVLELGCGRGEYTVAMAKSFPDLNFIGIDVKGARLWRGAKTINEEDIRNAAFLRLRIEWLHLFFEPGEAAQIWITFPDPQPQLSRENLRLTNPRFLSLYRSLSGLGGLLHLKTDNTGFFDYSVEMLEQQSGSFLVKTRDLYTSPPEGFDLSIRTTYEKIFMDKGELIKYLRFQWS